MKNPVATIYLGNGKKIVIELLPAVAPNTVNSFLYAAEHHVFDDHCIERVLPEDWIDVSYTGFRKKEGQYLIPYESDLHPEIMPLKSEFGHVCMGGYGKLGESGCEFFFPLRSCPEHRGIYPVFGIVREGREELLRIKNSKLEPVQVHPKFKVNRPIIPERITSVEVERWGKKYPEPERLKMKVIPSTWKL